MKKEDNINVPRWFLEEVENTLRIQHNINEPAKKKTGESCQDRNIKESLNGIRKLLQGEELTGMERLEKLQPSLPTNLDEAAEEYAYNNWQSDDYHKGASEGLPFDAIGHTKMCFKAGAKWMSGHGVSLSHLIAWYIQSVDAHEPAWTKEHLEELVKDYILIPKN